MRLIGFYDGPLWRFDLMPVHWQIAAVTLSVFYPFAASGLLVQTVENGLVMTNADPYAYPLIVSAIIFIAVLVDSVRTGILADSRRRAILGWRDRRRVALSAHTDSTILARCVRPGCAAPA